jgi:hypothetical protein
VDTNFSEEHVASTLGLKHTWWGTGWVIEADYKKWDHLDTWEGERSGLIQTVSRKTSFSEPQEGNSAIRTSNLTLIYLFFSNLWGVIHFTVSVYRHVVKLTKISRFC